MSISRYRKLIAILVLLLVLAEVGTVALSYRANDILATTLTIVGFAVILTLATLLLTRKDDWFFRAIVLIPLLGYVAFKLWVLFGFLTQVD